MEKGIQLEKVKGSAGVHCAGGDGGVGSRTDLRRGDI